MIEGDKGNPGIFGRVARLVQRMHTAHPDEVPASCVFFGHEEWNELIEICKAAEHAWPVGGVEKYAPEIDEETRGKITGLKIYRVDARTFLAVT